MASHGRDGSIWRFDIVSGSVGVDAASATTGRRARPARSRRARPVSPGIWETSGILNVSACSAGTAWLFDVQAHPSTTAPGVNTVEDGQLLLLKPTGD